MAHHETAMEMGMFVASLLMVLVPVLLGVAFSVFYYRTYRAEQQAALDAGERR